MGTADLGYGFRSGELSNLILFVLGMIKHKVWVKMLLEPGIDPQQLEIMRQQ